jgi:hypothetical protein
MGKVPLLNTETISKKATLALTSMAAKVEKSNSSVPSADKVAAIDDILSVTKSMSFYGASTKTYKNPLDSASGSFCTVPVKYEFKDRETKNQAEKILKATCNVNCGTPYPAILRDCIKQTGEHFRKNTGNSFVRVSVDASKLTLKVAHKKDKDAKWLYDIPPVPLPREVLDISARRSPEGFRMNFSPIVENTPMETDPLVEGAVSSPGSGRKSRKDSSEKSPPKV